MRLLQLNPNGNDASALDFHPMVTVVQGLSESGRRLVIDAITALPRGGDPRCHGLLEAHGVLLDLSPEALALLDLDGDLEVLVQAGDIPGFDGRRSNAAADTSADVGSAFGGRDPLAATGEPGTGSLPSSLAPLDVADFLAATPEGRYPELDEARVGQAQAREALEIMRGAVHRAQQGLEDAQVKRRRIELALDAARERQPRASLRLVTDEFEPDDVGGFGVDELDLDVTVGLEGDGGPHEPEPQLSVTERREAMEARMEVLQSTISRIDRGINELAGVDARPVQVLLDAIRNPAPVEMVPSARGQVLADEFVRLQSEVQVLEESLEARGLGSQSAMARLDAARQELAAAEKQMRPPEYTELDRNELEAAHDEVLEVTNKGRRGSGKKRLDEALAKEQAILDRMGFPTWSAYVMGAGLMSIDPAAEQRVENARFELESAERHWSDVAAMIEADPVHRQLLDQLEAVYLEAFDLLHGDDEQQDLEVKLRALEEPKREVSIDELVEALAYQLELVGIALPPEAVTLDRTVLIAEAFLEEAGAIIDRLNELGGEKVEALTELQSLEEEVAKLPVEDPMLAYADSDDGLAEPMDAVNGDEPEPEPEPEEEVPDLEALERDVELAAEEETDYRELLEAREALLDQSIRIETVAAAKVHRVAAELAAAHADVQADEIDLTAPAASAAGGDGFGDSSGDAFGDSFGDGLGGLDRLAAPASDAEFDVDGVHAGPEAVEFYLLGRLAALRSVSYAGSVPLVIDDALRGLPRGDVELVLHKLERMSESVQIVYLTDDDVVSSWARSIGFEHAAVIAAPPAFA